MRDVPESTAGLLAERATKPIYLIDLEFPSPEHLSTNGTHAIDGQTYTGGSVGLSAATDWRSAAVTLPPTAERLAELIAGAWRRRPAKVWLYPAVNYQRIMAEGYVQPGYARDGFVADAPILLLDGYVAAAGYDGQALRIEIAHRHSFGRWTPGIRLLPPLCNHLPAPGTVIAWAGENWILEAR